MAFNRDFGRQMAMPNMPWNGFGPAFPAFTPFMGPGAFAPPFMGPAFGAPFMGPGAFAPPFMGPGTFAPAFMGPGAFGAPFMGPGAIAPPFMGPGTFAPGAWGGGIATIGAQPAPDAEIQHFVERTIDNDPEIPAHAKIDVAVQNGVVTLTGTVSNKRIKHAAGDDAWWIPQVLDIHNQIQVSPRKTGGTGS